MTSLWTTAVWAVGLGIVTALHPCPFSTIGIATGFFVSLGRRWLRLTAFCLGSIATFAALGALISVSIVSTPGLSILAAGVFKPFLGPMLLLAGMIQGNFIRLPNHWKIAMTGAWKTSGLFGCFLGGALLAVAFCPATAGIFFVLLIPTSVMSGYTILPAALYGLGFSLVPLAIMSLFSLCSARLEQSGMRRFSQTANRAASSLLIIGGIYITIRHTF